MELEGQTIPASCGPRLCSCSTERSHTHGADDASRCTCSALSRLGRYRPGVYVLLLCSDDRIRDAAHLSVLPAKLGRLLRLHRRWSALCLNDVHPCDARGHITYEFPFFAI